ncbi:MAG: sodium:proton antiporter [Gammaproteobacteria bacterium]|nr:MAG: sodium:proton antiporter [Gammaproteobacteria bacterium]
MDVFTIIALLLTLAALFSYLNEQTLKLPTTVGLMLFALIASIAIIALDALGLNIKEWAADILNKIDFNKALLQGMLSYLLFAGALHININDLHQQKTIIALLASIGLIISTVIVGLITWLVLQWAGFGLPLIWCLVFGALISPTDPIAVIGILKTVGAPKTLETKIAGESLFNDGVAVVLFIVLFEIATGSSEPSITHILVLFVQEAVGGALFGLITGYIAYRMLRSVNNYSVEILITLALVSGGYALANSMHLSGPIAMVVAGLLIGNHGRAFAMSDKTRDHLDTFWELIDEILNAVLFVLIGLEVLILTFSGKLFIVSVLMIPGVLMARFISVGIPISLMRLKRSFSPNVIKILTWGGLRGGISVALALSIPQGYARELIVPITYSIVVFSILVQGLTVGRLIKST